MRQYEFALIIRGTETDEVIEGIVDQFVDLAKENGADVGEVERWGRRKLAYDIVTIDVPAGPSALAAGEALWDSLLPVHPQGQLSFWEFYAVNALEERFPSVGLAGDEVELDREMRVALSSSDAGIAGSRVAGSRSTVSGNEIIGIAVTRVDPDGPMTGVEPGRRAPRGRRRAVFRGRGGLASCIIG